jgi:hypothetical protein
MFIKLFLGLLIFGCFSVSLFAALLYGFWDQLMNDGPWTEAPRDFITYGLLMALPVHLPAWLMGGLAIWGLRKISARETAAS